MSDWQIGDLVVCIHTRPRCAFTPPPLELEAGRVYCVIGICDAATIDPGLLLEGVRSCHRTGSYSPFRFRKIYPDDQEACEPEFVTLLKRSKQRVSA